MQGSTPAVLSEEPGPVSAEVSASEEEAPVADVPVETSVLLSDALAEPETLADADPELASASVESLPPVAAPPSSSFASSGPHPEPAIAHAHSKQRVRIP